MTMILKSVPRLLVGTMLAAALLFDSGSAAAQARVTLGSGFNLPQGVAIDSSGNVFVADTGNAEVKEILAPNYTTTIQIATVNGNFSAPSAIAIDTNGNLFVADTGSGTVKKILAASGYVTVTTIASGFSLPTGIAVDRSGNVFVADFGTNHMYELLVATGYATRITLSVPFASLSGVAVDSSGNLFIADQNDGVQEIPAASDYLTVVNLASGNQNIVQPFGIAVDGSGNVFFSDLALGAGFEIRAAEGYTTVIPCVGALNEPSSLTVDGRGNIYIAETNNNTVDELVSATTTIVTSSLNPSTLGASVTFTATVSVSAGTPTGTVAFMDGGNALGSVGLSAGVATLATSALGLGAHSITARYSSDSNYAPSTSTVLTQTVAVSKAITSILLDSSASPATLYAAADTEGVYKKSIADNTWSVANGASPNTLTNLRVKVLARAGAGVFVGTLYAATYGSGVFKSADAAANWNSCGTSGLTNMNLVSLIIDGSGKLYAGTEAGVFVSADGCATWTAMNNGLPN